jgi:hypothetical protein
VPWHWRGMGPSRVARIESKDGRWTRVELRWQAGCVSVPEYEGQPENEWKCPVDSEWLTREEFEEARRRWTERRS